ncbi:MULTISPECIES: cupin domain-containing protein [Microbacterium]|jgi:quercetin dioxygenase-like cupin family protein/quinol monooxygenase YgiN|uniref:cupin domain-containing protein n=1 Tax=Microbacterium TaxID=33882 RepID=UPI00278833DC|nr:MULTISPECIES: cupin domain-containing protein [Microbacterium]MDQ1074699.1 quercetin dioxygenase-like cupin family protein/quinol monooxygenase YgiN [Microbacterium sp. SORGH_AS_0969]MDQ1114924.1 quercetin dioxygenase-like cupin family protein/quinol monooxygenase YgiN [Microbacterium testaceum]
MSIESITSQPAHVFRPEQLPSKNRGGGARTIPLVTAARGATTYLNGVTIFEPGAAIGHHTHNVAESVMVIAGRAVVDIDGERTALNTFDTTFVPANVAHHFENASDTEEMRIFWTYGSLDATRTLTASGEHGRVDAESADTAAGSVRMVTEMATIDVLPGHKKDFEAAVAKAAPLFQRARGARTLRLESSEESPQTYRLFVGWESIDDHESFRASAAFSRWRELIGPHLGATPQVEHLRNTLTAF